MKIKKKTVKDIMDLITKQPITINSNQDINILLEAMLKDNRTRHVYVVDDSERMIGSIRLNNIIEFIAPYLDNLDDDMFNQFISRLIKQKVSKIMLKDFLFLREDMPLNEMVDVMLEHKVNELPVLDDNGKIIGDVNFLEFIKFLDDNKYLAINESKG